MCFEKLNKYEFLITDDTDEFHRFIDIYIFVERKKGNEMGYPIANFFCCNSLNTFYNIKTFIKSSIMQYLKGVATLKLESNVCTGCGMCIELPVQSVKRPFGC